MPHFTLSSQVLCRFLYKVKSYADSNKMDLQNLAIVFSPTMIRTAGGNINQEMSDMKSMKEIIQVRFIKDAVYKEVFLEASYENENMRQFGATHEIENPFWKQ